MMIGVSIIFVFILYSL